MQGGDAIEGRLHSVGRADNAIVHPRRVTTAKTDSLRNHLSNRSAKQLARDSQTLTSISGNACRSQGTNHGIEARRSFGWRLANAVTGASKASIASATTVASRSSGGKARLTVRAEVIEFTDVACIAEMVGIADTGTSRSTTGAMTTTGDVGIAVDTSVRDVMIGSAVSAERSDLALSIVRLTNAVTSGGASAVARASVRSQAICAVGVHKMVGSTHRAGGTGIALTTEATASFIHHAVTIASRVVGILANGALPS